MRKILIATIEGMIEKEDVVELNKFAEVDWIVKEHIDDVED